MSTLNLVKFFFLQRPASATTVRQYIAIAYQTARDQKIHPTAILIRSGIHGTTTIGGKYQKVPKGEHLTLCFKDGEMSEKGTHVASHGYVNSRQDWEIREASHSPEKHDATVARGTGRAIWPAEAMFEIEVAFGHVPDETEIKLPEE
ncbi:uncharacterized protein CIMG_05191 [Coccidioides immitis RS]|uniref:Uncharacterized protein n=3 Tax=Coccidioides immitis TaxID=5501 RepID=J3KF21_COCIM|nr:uncharacterized protein CIMG_05191 [Coccidioides immitis RS]EAS34167.3 hypothetical protein CIMG_05191 [Coccidioides immitis RS]KMP05362.1 hypothetical protein CIRG_05043 [Coccidioides immitis RMSCC 2394]KMU73841.1 hypothetical protein CISG_10228 [Coccidioides immitis RMSCC 3703]TPX21711.1 hypothetical protein DIZ76_015673 [Coccidioides immitis]